MLSDRLHLNPPAALLLWLLRWEIQIRGRGAENWTDSINWMGSHQPIVLVPQSEGVKGKGCKDARFMEEGPTPRLFTFFLFFFLPLSSLPPSFSFSSVFKPISVLLTFLWIIGTHILEAGENAIGTYAHMHIHAHTHICTYIITHTERDKHIRVHTYSGINTLCIEQQQ